MQLGKFGIAHPIPNYRFQRPKVVEATLQSIVGNVITVNLTGVDCPSDLDYFFGPPSGVGSKQKYGRLNKIIVGPSTNAANLGATQTFDVLSIATSTAVTCQQSSLYVFSAGDPITMVGVGIPDGWVNQLSGGYFQGGWIFEDGYVDHHRFLIYRPVANNPRQVCYLDIGYLLPRTTYRASIVYKAVTGTEGAATNNSFRIEEGVGGTNHQLPVYYRAAYTEQTVTFTTEEDQSIPAILGWQGIQTYANVELSLAAFSLSHASHSAADYSSGISQFTMYPSLGGVSIDRVVKQTRLIETMDYTRLIPAALSSLTLPLTRYIITYDFDNISGSEFEKLRALYEFQERGFLINHYPGLAGVPFVLTGRIGGDITRAHRIENLATVSFRLRFEEVLM